MNNINVQFNFSQLRTQAFRLAQRFCISNNIHTIHLRLNVRVGPLVGHFTSASL
jgi:hypothetical protein